MYIIKKISDGIEKMSELLAALLMVSVTLVLLLQVILRSLFESGIPWADEFARYSVIWIVMLVANVLVKRGELISVDFLDEFWPERFKKWRNMVYQLIFLFLVLVLFKEGWTQAIDGLNATTTSMRIQWFYPYLSIPVGSFLILYQFFYGFLLNYRKEG